MAKDIVKTGSTSLRSTLSLKIDSHPSLHWLQINSVFLFSKYFSKLTFSLHVSWPESDWTSFGGLVSHCSVDKASFNPAVGWIEDSNLSNLLQSLNPSDDHCQCVSSKCVHWKILLRSNHTQEQPLSQSPLALLGAINFALIAAIRAPIAPSPMRNHITTISLSARFIAIPIAVDQTASRSRWS